MLCQISKARRQPLLHNVPPVPQDTCLGAYSDLLFPVQVALFSSTAAVRPHSNGDAEQQALLKSPLEVQGYSRQLRVRMGTNWQELNTE